MLDILDRFHRWCLQRGILRNLTVASRLLLAIGFIPPGMTKVLGERFARISTDNPVGFYFEAFYQTGAYYQFVGAAQVLAGLLLLVPRTATLGALLYLPIIGNIFVLTLSMDFRGTPVVTGLMLLATLYLLWWDFDRLRVLIPGTPPPGERPPEPVVPEIGSFRFAWSWAAALVLGLWFFLFSRSLAPIPRPLPALGLLLAGLVADLTPSLRPWISGKGPARLKRDL